MTIKPTEVKEEPKTDPKTANRTAGKGELERRVFKIELRKAAVPGVGDSADDTNAPSILEGHSAVFNTPADINGWFMEIFLPGAFKRTIMEKDDVRALFNHDPNFILGRTKSGTLALKEDETGLFSTITLPETNQAKDIATSVARGDIDQQSIGFIVRSEEWKMIDGVQHRYISDAQLFDISPVTFPAFDTTTISARCKEYINGDKNAASKAQADITIRNNNQTAAMRLALELKSKEV